MWFHVGMVTGERTTRFHGPSIRAWREQRGLSVAETGRLLGVNGSWVSNVEADRRPPSREKAFALATLLGIRDMRAILRDYPDVPLPVDRPDDWPEEWR